MKPISFIIAAAFTLFANAIELAAQEYRESLHPVYLTALTSKTNQQISTNELHHYLLQKEDFSFRREIKTARTHRAKLLLSDAHSEKSISTASYLRTLRRIGNKSSTLEQFTSLLSEELSVTKSEIMALEDIDALYEVIRQNTFYGKLDIVGSELTWL